MLKLTRRIGQDEYLYLVDDEKKPIARIELLERRGNQVTIGIEAPQNVQVLRDELVRSDVQMEYDTYLNR